MTHKKEFAIFFVIVLTSIVLLSTSLASHFKKYSTLRSNITKKGYVITDSDRIYASVDNTVDILVLERPAEQRIISCVNPRVPTKYVLTLHKSQVESVGRQMDQSGFTCRYIGGKYFNNEDSNS